MILQEPEGITEYIGTGPYKLDEWKQDQYIHLVRYEDYAQPAGESSGFTGEKLAATPDIYFRVVTDDSTGLPVSRPASMTLRKKCPRRGIRNFPVTAVSSFM